MTSAPLLLAACAGTTPAPAPTATPVEATSTKPEVPDGTWNVSRERVALGGYDPVSYFTKAGPVAGDPAIAAEHRGIVYLFASSRSRDAFLRHPEQYVPAYGGWCAYAMAQGTRFRIDPEHFRIQGGRLLLFYPGTDTQWDEGDVAARARDADAAWESMQARR